MPEQPQNIQIIPPGVTKWNGRTLLNAHGCVLLERFTGKIYTYHVVDMKTCTSAHICHKPNPIPETEREAMIKRFLESLATSCAISGTVSSSGYCVEVKRDGRAADCIVTEALVYIFEKLMPNTAIA